MSIFNRVKGIISTEKNGYNFKYLDDLIHSGDNEIVLDEDITLGKNEEESYMQGINLNVDDLTIEGNNHIIDANKISKFFSISGKNVLIKNVIFKNGFSDLQGPIFASYGASPTLMNCTFKDNVGSLGGIISTNIGSSLKLIGCSFENNVATREGGAIQSQGDIEIKDTVFLDNSAPLGGAIVSMGNATIEKCTFKSNIASENTGGAIVNTHNHMKIIDSIFEKNQGILGGAINNRDDARLEIISSTIKGNIAKSEGSGIFNSGEITIANSKIHDNRANEKSVIFNQKNSAKIEKSFISDNTSILNIDASLEIVECELLDNISPSSLVFSEKGNLKITDSLIKNNKSVQPLIYSNWARTEISNINLIGNVSPNLLIFNVESEFTISKSLLELNNCDDRLIYNQNGDFLLFNTTIDNHQTQKDILFNEGKLEIGACQFNNNRAENIIENVKESILTINGSDFSNNHSLISTICNNGASLSISNTNFIDNSSTMEFKDNIFNESFLRLVNAKFNNEFKSVFNKGLIETRKLSSEDIENNIHNEGEIEVLDEVPNFSETNFSFIDEEIHRLENPNVILENDITLSNFERDFFEGGIDLDIDDVVIDGNNHYIDARNKTRIFNVTGRNITLKNIKFKNGFTNDSERNANGGGALKIAKGASLTLENCQFIDNNSNNSGGAIFNSGDLKSQENLFIGNNAKLDGGAVYNKNLYKTKNDVFESNRSRIGSCIYNENFLLISTKISAENNKSNFNEDIYNVNLIKTEDFTEKNGILVYGMGKIDVEDDESFKSFSYLEEQINNSNEVILGCDIKYNHKIDEDLKNGLIIDKEGLTIDGNGHAIDGNNSASIFAFTNISGRITLKNIRFKNLYSFKNSIIDSKSSLTIENCIFINNNSASFTSLINNHHNMSIDKTVFVNNSSNKSSLILNNDISEIAKEVLIPHGRVGNRLHIKDSVFVNNFIYHGDGGVITNENGEIPNYINLIDSEFNSNISGRSGGAINNHSLIKLENDRFINNISKRDGGAIINDKDAKIEIINSRFINNKSGSGGAISSFSEKNIKLVGCDFENNSPDDVFSMNKLEKNIMEMHDEDELKNIIKFETDPDLKGQALLRIFALNNLDLDPSLMYQFLMTEINMPKEEATELIFHFMETLNRVMQEMNRSS